MACTPLGAAYRVLRRPFDQRSGLSGPEGVTAERAEPLPDALAGSARMERRLAVTSAPGLLAEPLSFGRAAELLLGILILRICWARRWTCLPAVRADKHNLPIRNSHFPDFEFGEP